MNSRALRRLATDHGMLHNQELPPNYLFPASAHADDLTQLDILLAGPTHTPFAAGLWKLHLSIPSNYPQQPPTANFRTPIFHPNVDPQTGGVCVETLKRDWDSKLTLRDVLITISCLLIQPNPDSALNAEAGALIQEDYATFAKRAELMTSIHAIIPKTLHTAVQEAQNRGQEKVPDESVADEKMEGLVQEAPARRRRTIAKVRGSQRADTTVHATAARQPPQASQNHPFVFQAGNDDVFGISLPAPNVEPPAEIFENDESMDEGDQENDANRSPQETNIPMPAMTPRRPRGVAVPLGEMILDQLDSSSEMEPEYPPSPRKSPSKSPPKRRQRKAHASADGVEQAESSRGAALRAPNITPPNHHEKPLSDESFLMDVTFENSPSPRKTRRGLFNTPPMRPGRPSDVFDSIKHGSLERQGTGIIKTRTPSTSLHGKQEAERKRTVLEDQLWTLCGGDIKRWNRGDFDGMPFKKKVARW